MAMAADPYGHPGGVPLEQPGQNQAFEVQPGYANHRYQVNWASFNTGNQPLPHKFQGLEEDKQQAKMATADEYVGVLQANKPFPPTRSCKDVAFALLFFVASGAMAAFLILNFSKVNDAFKGIDAGGIQNVSALLLPMSSGAGGAMMACAAFVLLMRTAPGCVVWTSLLLGPALMFAVGGALIALIPGNVGLICGGICIAMALCSLFCLFFCWREFIPFTIQLAETLAVVMQQNPCTVFVAFLGGFIGLLWPFFCILTLIALDVDVSTNLNNRPLQIGFFFVLIWGMFIASYWTHTILCGIYARWYYAKDKGSEVTASIKTASTSAFGSICCGAFIIAAIRTIELTLRMLEQQAAEDGNPALMIAIMVVRCCVSCLGDLVEYISEWAYVQVAVRGTSFCESAKCCYALLTWGNMEFILCDLLIDSVGLMATLMCFAAGVGFGILGNAGNWNEPNGVLVGAILGLLPAIMIASAAGNVITAGSKTILASWAEHPEELAQHRPDLHQKFLDTMVKNMPSEEEQAEQS